MNPSPNIASEIQFGELQVDPGKDPIDSDWLNARTSVTAHASARMPRKTFIVEWSALREAAQHARSDRDREVGGILLGQPWQHANGESGVWFAATLAAVHHRHTPASFTFTHDTWSTLHAEWKNRYPELRIVGWYHTHPGWGIFLSPQDRFICDHYFPEWYHSALVLDPRSETWGMFERASNQKMQARSQLWLRSPQHSDEHRARLAETLSTNRAHTFHLAPLIDVSC